MIYCLLPILSLPPCFPCNRWKSNAKVVYGVLKVFKFKQPEGLAKLSRKGYKLGNKISNINGLFSS